MSALEHLQTIERLLRENDVRRRAEADALEQLAAAKRTCELFRQRFRTADDMIAKARKHMRSAGVARPEVALGFKRAYDALDFRRARR